MKYGERTADPVWCGASRSAQTLSWTRGAETRICDALRMETQHRSGVHKYELHDFGVTERDVERSFEKYRSALGV